MKKNDKKLATFKKILETIEKNRPAMTIMGIAFGTLDALFSDYIKRLMQKSKAKRLKRT